MYLQCVEVLKSWSNILIGIVMVVQRGIGTKIDEYRYVYACTFFWYMTQLKLRFTLASRNWSKTTKNLDVAINRTIREPARTSLRLNAKCYLSICYRTFSFKVSETKISKIQLPSFTAKTSRRNVSCHNE